MPYLDVAAFKVASILPATYVDGIEASEVGWTLAALTRESGWIDSRLRKRYSAPFDTPYPPTVIAWLEAIVSDLVLLKRGIDPSDSQAARVADRATAAKAEIAEAADSDRALFDLPLAGTSATAISQGGVLASHEASPYAWTQQRRADGDLDEYGP
jgi:hypothetical protein